MSTFHPDTRGRSWSLTSAHLFSCAVGREHCKQTSLACVGVRAVSGPLWVCPAHTKLQAALQGSCLKRVLGCVRFPGLSRSGSGSRVLHRGTDSVGPAFCAFPRSEQLRPPGACRAHCPRWVVHLITSLVPAGRFPGCAAGALSHGYRVPPLGSSSLTVALLVDVSRPGSQEDLLSNCEPAQSLVEDAISGAEIALRLPTLAAAYLPPSLPLAGDGPVRSRLALLWYSLSRWFCERAWQCLRLELFTGEFSLALFPLSGCPTVWVAIPH